MEYTKGKKARSGAERFFRQGGGLKLKRLKGLKGLKGLRVAAAIFCTFLAVFAVVMADSKESAAASVAVGVTIPSVVINQSAPVQNATPSVNGTNVSIRLPVAYNGIGLQNLTISIPTSWKKLTNVKINESGVIKNVTVSGGQLTWEVNYSATDVHMIFDAAPPSLTAAPQFFNSSFFQKNLTIESDNAFINVSADISVNSSYAFYTLYWHNGTQFVDKTIGFNLNVTNGTATFDSFHTLTTVLFKLEGSTSCTESWSCTGWSDPAQCGTRTCTDANHCGTTNSKPSESSSCETQQAPAAGGGGGGGGGGGNATKPKTASQPSGTKVAAEKTLEVSPAARQLLKVFIRQGEFKKTSFSVKNIGGKRLGLNIRSEGLTDFLTLLTSHLELEPGDSRNIEMLFLADMQAQPGTYSGKIIISTEETEELIVDVLLDVTPLKALFDTLVNVNQKTKSVQPGDSVLADIAIFNLLGAGKFDVRVIYGIKDFTDKLITSKQQTVAVETRAGLAAVLELPEDVPPGQYYVFAVVQLDGETVGVGSDTFNVVSPLKFGKAAPIGANALFILLLLFMILILLLMFFSVAELLRHHLPRKTIPGRQAAAGPAARKTTEQKPPAAATAKLPAAKPITAVTAAKAASQKALEEKLKALEQAFSGGMVSNKAYIEDKTKIKNELKKIKTK